ncbi:Imm49 family immunity protein [Kitasatospora sp. LaBMicrA B282]|uniref:immunity 49 family protein n=1 Tax=Kitasatospora sp. LaBMicrA B282 TaxID=3420949 RepID=UPI003D0A5D4E
MERHQVGAAAVSAAREGFAERIGGEVHSMSRAGRMTSSEWQLIADEFLDHLGALSAADPELTGPQAAAVLKAATEAAAGAVAYAAYFPHGSFHVVLDYLNFGMSYRREDAGDDGDGGDGGDGWDAAEEAVTPSEWLDAFCLAILSDATGRHGEAFHFARAEFDRTAAGTPAVELVNGFMAQVSGDTGDEDADHPPSAEAKLAAIDAALARIDRRAADHGVDLADRPHTVALCTLRALAAADRAAFDTGLTALLQAHRDSCGPGARPSSLLPLLPLALAALGHRGPGWTPEVDTDYLPRTLVSGFESAGPRVGGLGRDRRPDAVAALASGPLVVERPAPVRPQNPEDEAGLEERLGLALDPTDGKPPRYSLLASALQCQEIVLKLRAWHSADLTDAQLTNLRQAAQLAAAVFRVALADPGTEARVTIDGRTFGYPATRDWRTDPPQWQSAVDFALITGVPEHLAVLVRTGPAVSTKDDGPTSSYRRALHDYFRGVDPEPATEQALRTFGDGRDRGFLPPPAVLLSQLVDGDEESFNLALADALEAHRAFHQVAARAAAPDAALNLDILALACHAHRSRRWRIRVDSSYLPPRLFQGGASA